MSDCIFCKIAKGDIPKEFEYQDETVMVFKDINPVKPIHVLIVPKAHVPEFSHAEELLLGKLYTVVQKMVVQLGLKDRGYRIVVNGGGAQFVDHLHIHLIGPMGKKADW